MTEELAARVDEFRRGLIEGYQVGWNNGFWNGCGAEKEECGRCLERAMPPGTVILDSTTTDLLRIALEEKRSEIIKLLTTGEVAQAMLGSLQARRGLSVVRVGESESLVLAQEVVLSFTEIIIRGNNLIPAMSGVNVPDLEARDMLAYSLKKADIVGVPTPLLPNHLPLAHASLRALGVDLRKLKITSSVINYALLHEGHLAHLLLDNGPRVLTVGDIAEGLANALSQEGVKVVGAVAPVEGMRDIDRVMGEVRRFDFDVALVPAAVPAVVICQRIATELGKIALDFGHCANQLIDGSAKLQPSC